MRTSSHSFFHSFPFFSLSLFAICLFLFGCNNSSESENEISIDFNLSDSLKNYSQVFITLHDSQDPEIVLDTVFIGKLIRPETLPTYPVPQSFGSDFRIRIQGYDANGLLSLESFIFVSSGTAGKTIRTSPESLPGWGSKNAPPSDSLAISE